METNKKPPTEAQKVVDKKAAKSANKAKLPPLSPAAQNFINMWCSNMPPAAQAEFLHSLTVEVKRLASVVHQLTEKKKSPIIRPGH